MPPRTPAPPHQDSQRGVALSVGICPGYGEIDPYAMAWAAVDEAVRNLVAVGADPDQVALLDNFCWGNPNLPDRLGSLVRCTQGCYDAAVAYDAPFISGKDSLNNEYTGADGQRHAIPGTLLISALGIVPDTSRTVTMDLKQSGNLLYVVGETRDELGGSHYQNFVLKQNRDAMPPQPVPKALTLLRTLHQAIANGLVQACHDCSEGGLGVALAEMCLAGRLGVALDLALVPGSDKLLTPEQILFSESLTRFIIEVLPENARALEQILTNVPHARVGQVNAGSTLQVRTQNDPTWLSVDVADLETAWRSDVEQTGRGAGRQGSRHPVPISNPSTTLRTGLQSSNPSTTLRTSLKTSTPPDTPITSYQLQVAGLTQNPRILILHANGTNRDQDAALACDLAGGDSEIVHINQLLSGERQLLDYHMLVVPGGFSYGDDLGAGSLWALDLRHRFGDDLARFVEGGRPVLGICNGFQALVKSGLLPGSETSTPQPLKVTLAPNASGQFECRWVYLQPNPNCPSLFTAGLTEPIYCPVAHGEGRVAVADDNVLEAIQSQNLYALTYVNLDGSPAAYPANPNGSVASIAGLCNPAGNVLGLMPHPENHIFPWQHPHAHRGELGLSGLRLFKNGVRQA